MGEPVSEEVVWAAEVLVLDEDPVHPARSRAVAVRTAGTIRLRARTVRHDTGRGRASDLARRPPMQQLELLRHAPRDPDADRLSAAGRALAEDTGRARRPIAYAAVFVSPAGRAAETAAWFLRGLGAPLPEHEVVPGLAGLQLADLAAVMTS